MANVNVLFNEKIFNITPEEADWICKDLTGPEESETEKWGKERGIEGDALTFWPDFEWEFEDKDKSILCIYSEESFSLDNVINFVQRFFTECRPNAIFSLTWVVTRDYIGGAAVVTATAFRTIDVYDWVDQQREELFDELSR
jgi:hypothetical protein